MNILIADDHPLYREALGAILEELEVGVTILHAGSFDEAIGRVSEADPEIDLILLDLYMSGGDCGAVIEHLRMQKPQTPVIVISGSDSRKDAERAMRAGSFGYIPKSMRKEEILSAIRLILTSGVCIQPRDIGNVERQPSTIEPTHVDGRISNLTARQRDVLFEIGVGKSNKLIARSLGMTEGTVKLHVAAILKSLGLSNRTQAAIAANQMKQITSTSSGDQESADE